MFLVARKPSVIFAGRLPEPKDLGYGNANLFSPGGKVNYIDLHSLLPFLLLFLFHCGAELGAPGSRIEN